MLGLGLVGVAVALGWLGWYGRAEAALATWLVIGVLIVVIGGLGILDLVAVFGAGPSWIEIGELGVRSNLVTPPWWSWTDVGRATVTVRVRRESQIVAILAGTVPTPAWVRSEVRIRIDLEPSPDTPRRPARIRVTEPFISDGEDIAIVRDLDAALRWYAGARYAGVTKDVRTRP